MSVPEPPSPTSFLLCSAAAVQWEGAATKAKEETQGSLFQPRRQRAPLSAPGPLPHRVSDCEGVEPVGGCGGRWGEEPLKTGLPTQLQEPQLQPVCLSRTCFHLRRRPTVSILPNLC
jgi:hypothetical protein